MKEFIIAFLERCFLHCMAHGNEVMINTMHTLLGYKYNITVEFNNNVYVFTCKHTDTNSVVTVKMYANNKYINKIEVE